MPVYYDPYDVDIMADPYPTYSALRDEAPIYHNQRYDFWALSRHADVDRALSDWETFSNSRSDILDGRIYADYVEWRSQNPSDDLMTALLNVEFTDEQGVTRKLNRKEVLHYTQVVAGAGNETTGRLIGWLAKVLAEHPDQRRQVTRDRSLLTRAIDETL